MSELEHERWSAERTAQGWTYGPTRDNDALLHPDLVPWPDLPEQRKEVNYRLVRQRPRLLAHVGIEIYRPVPG
jgi:hypothetical protein